MALTVKIQSKIGLRRIAIGCLHLMVNRASLEFPTTTRAHPSFEVVVVLTPGGLLRQQDFALFPFSVPWDVWEKVVVPVLLDETLKVRVTEKGLRVMNNQRLLEQDVDGLVAMILEALVRSFQKHGYLPTEDAPEVVINPSVPGEPINRTSEAPLSPYPRYDDE